MADRDRIDGGSHLPGEAGTADVEEDTEPIVKMAGAAGIDSRGSKSDQVSLLRYFWSVETDQISPAKGDDLNFHPAKRGHRPDWVGCKIFCQGAPSQVGVAGHQDVPKLRQVCWDQHKQQCLALEGQVCTAVPGEWSARMNWHEAAPPPPGRDQLIEKVGYHRLARTAKQPATGPKGNLFAPPTALTDRAGQGGAGQEETVTSSASKLQPSGGGALRQTQLCCCVAVLLC